MQNFFEFLKNNEKTKHSITKETLDTSENSVYLSNFSLWDFKKIREVAKKTKKNFQDVGLSPINNKNLNDFSNSLNISSISKDSSQYKIINGSLPNSLSKKKAEFSFEEKELKKLQGQIEEYKAQIQENNEKLVKFQNICHKKEEELETFSSKIQDFELISKKNEVLMEYLKEKEIKIMGFEKQVQNLQKELLASEKSRAVLHEQIQELKGSLRIFCRIKPTNDQTNSIISVPEINNSNVLELKNPNNTRTAYYFDQIFCGNCDQKSIFQEILPFIQSAIDGEQVSILAYGQTGSGKTFTLEGNGVWEGEEGFCEEFRGIMPRAVEFIFNEKKRMEVVGKSMKFLLSIIEIYNENLTDLLTPGIIFIHLLYYLYIILENKPSINQLGGKVVVKNLASFEITDMMQLVQLIKKAAKTRVTDKTQFNERSSRSHCIYRMNISYHNDKDKEGVLNIVDLAGSERSSNQFIEDMAHEKDKEKVYLFVFYKRIYY